jgi:hypothetical protein
MKVIITLLFTFLLQTSFIYQQSNNFKLGFTGAYPSDFLFTENSGQNWSWYTDMKMNVWQGWWN